MKRCLFSACFTLAIVCRLFALTPDDLSHVRFDQYPGRQLPGHMVFRDDKGEPFRLNEYLSERKQPVILVLGYYRCPMLCSLINDGLIQTLQELRLSVGHDFQVINLSIDPTEQPAAAAAKKAEYLRHYGRDGAAPAWHCLVGDEQSIKQLTESVGYRSVYDPETRQYAHPSGVILLTPEGVISRYFLGVNFKPRELRDGLVAAKKGRSSSVISQILLLCYHYSPITGRYGAAILSLVRGAGALMVVLIIGGIVVMAGRDRRRPRPIAASGIVGPPPENPQV